MQHSMTSNTLILYNKQVQGSLVIQNTRTLNSATNSSIAGYTRIPDIVIYCVKFRNLVDNIGIVNARSTGIF